MAAASENFFNEDNFDTVLVTFCCYDYDTKSSEAIEKIATD